MPYLTTKQIRRPDEVEATVWLRLPVVTGYIKQHHASTNNKALAKTLNCGLTTLRNRVYELGLLRMELEYWTEQQVADLRALYTTMGDLEIAVLFQQRYPKEKGWTKKHIAKKRGYLDLHRSPKSLEIIHARFLGNEVAEREYEFRSPGTVGERRIFHKKGGKKMLHIKRPDGSWRPAGPIIWQQLNGPVPEGHQVYFKDGDPSNCDPDNLGLITISEKGHLTSAKSSVGLSDRYVASLLVGTRSTLPKAERVALRESYQQHPELLELQRNHVLLKRATKQAQSNA